MHDSDISKLVEVCKTTFDLTNAALPDNYGYKSLPLCVIDAVFSIGVHYRATENTVNRFRRFIEAPVGGDARSVDNLSMAEFVQILEASGPDVLATQVFQNKQRTSVRNGILKAEAVLRFSRVLLQFDVKFLSDVVRFHDICRPELEFEAAIRRIPGQRSGISLWYFYMLTGSENHIKPDRMIARFIQTAIGRSPSVEESHEMVLKTSALLRQEYAHLTPRLLDRLIWEYQRQQSAK